MSDKKSNLNDFSKKETKKKVATKPNVAAPVTATPTTDQEIAVQQ